MLDCGRHIAPVLLQALLRLHPPTLPRVKAPDGNRKRCDSRWHPRLPTVIVDTPGEYYSYLTLSSPLAPLISRAGSLIYV